VFHFVSNLVATKNTIQRMEDIGVKYPGL